MEAGEGATESEQAKSRAAIPLHCLVLVTGSGKREPTEIMSSNAVIV